MAKQTKPIFGIKTSRFTEFCGWYGLVALIIAYGLASFGVIPADGVIYLVLNLTGGIGLLIIAAAKGILQSVLLNIFWAIIGFVALAKILFW